MEEKLEDLKRIFNIHKFDTEDLTIEQILKESRFIKDEKDFNKVYQEYLETEEEENWATYNRSLI